MFNTCLYPNIFSARKVTIITFKYSETMESHFFETINPIKNPIRKFTVPMAVWTVCMKSHRNFNMLNSEWAPLKKNNLKHFMNKWE